MTGRTRSRRRIESDIEQTRTELGETVTALAAKTDVKAQAVAAAAGAKESVHDATARIKEAAERAAAQASQTTHEVAEKTADTARTAREKTAAVAQAARAKTAPAVVVEKVESVKEQVGGARQAVRDRAEIAKEKAEIAKDRAITETTVDLREQAAKTAPVTQELSDKADEAVVHVGQPTAERATRAATTAADLGGHLAHQVADASHNLAGVSHNLADTARHQLLDGRPADRLRRPVPLALAGAAALVLTGAIALFRNRRHR